MVKYATAPSTKLQLFVAGKIGTDSTCNVQVNWQYFFVFSVSKHSTFHKKNPPHLVLLILMGGFSMGKIMKGDLVARFR